MPRLAFTPRPVDIINRTIDGEHVSIRLYDRKVKPRPVEGRFVYDMAPPDRPSMIVEREGRLVDGRRVIDITIQVDANALAAINQGETLTLRRNSSGLWVG